MAQKLPWETWEREYLPEEEEMKPLPKVDKRIPRVVHWRSQTGKWVVVQGPFPDQMYRSETRDTVEKASKLSTDNLYNRGETTKEDHYAKVLAKDIQEIDSGENEWGPVSP